MTAVNLDLAELIRELEARGYKTFGPRIRDGAIVHDRIESADDLPVGWTDEQAGGHYRLVARNDPARFGYAVGPQSWKELLHPARSKVWEMRRDADGAVQVEMTTHETVKRAFVGVRPCELAAISRQDHVLLDGRHPDPAYAANRADVMLIAVNCGDPAATCFCTSMGTGPAARAGYDVLITELVDGHEARYLAEPGSDAGEEFLDALTTEPATEQDRSAARDVIEAAAERITKRLETDGVRDVLFDRLDSPRWEAIGERCLTCGNCTLVCPTCFCTDLVDVGDLSGATTERWRLWDTCFSLEFSHLGPGPHRASPAARYRQWMTHKLAGWLDQFGESGCVGCGRCITWCPVGIDITDEAAAFREEVMA